MIYESDAGDTCCQLIVITEIVHCVSFVDYDAVFLENQNVLNISNIT